jgi:hypothetical protein
MEITHRDWKTNDFFKETQSFISSNFNLKKIASMKQPNYVDCGIYTSLNMCIILSLLERETETLNISELYKLVILDNLLPETSKIHPNNSPYSVEEVSVHRRSIGDSIAKLNGTFNGGLDINIATTGYFLTVIFVNFVNYINFGLLNLGNKPENAKIGCKCCLRLQCEASSEELQSSGDFSRCITAGCENVISNICSDKLSEFDSNEYPSKICFACYDSNKSQFKRAESSVMKSVKALKSNTVSMLYKECSSEPLDIFNIIDRLGSPESQNFKCNVSSCDQSLRGYDCLDRCVYCPIIHIFCNFHKTHEDHAQYIYDNNEMLDAYGKLSTENERDIQNLFGTENDPDNKIEEGIIGNHDESIVEYVECDVIRGGTAAASYNWSVWKFRTESVLKLEVNGNLIHYVRDIFDSVSTPARLLSFSPSPYPEEDFFKLYAWVILGLVVLENNIVYISCCALEDINCTDPAKTNRYILCRILLSMCNSPIRAYYIFDTEAPNKQRQFYFLYGM